MTGQLLSITGISAIVELITYWPKINQSCDVQWDDVYVLYDVYDVLSD